MGFCQIKLIRNGLYNNDVGIAIGKQTSSFELKIL